MVFSQSANDSLNNSKSLLFSRFYKTAIPNKINYYPNRSLSIYNPNTKLNDTYFEVKNTFYYSASKSEIINMNGFSKKDSFTPCGLNDFRGAIVMGFLNLLFEKH
jgi:hypothetical protein